MPRTKKGTPLAYRRHSSGQAVVKVRLADGRRHGLLLGPFDSPASHERYAEVLRVLAVHGGRYPIGPSPQPADGRLSVNEVLLAWLRHAEAERGPDNKELRQYKYALCPVRELFGHEPAERFTPKALRAVLKNMGERGWCRGVINHNHSRVKAVFSGAAAEELILPSIAHGLREVKGFRRGDRQGKESAPRQPAFGDDVAKVLPFCPRLVAAMLQLQWLTGMRSGEVRVMPTMDIDRTDAECWQYRPGSDVGPFGDHKNAWRGQERVVPLGPQCVEVLRPFLRDDDPAASSSRHGRPRRTATRPGGRLAGRR